jgi:hypothetical protein
VLTIPPQAPGTGEQIELRAVYVLKNANTGNQSDAKSAFIAP